MRQTPAVSEKVWRYMSFSRFVWLLQNKRLWLSRADLLGDPWEIALAGDQLKHVVARHPPHDIFSDKPFETAITRQRRIIKTWRRETFVSCWSASEHESHALWRIYCRGIEGVAIQTTFSKLQDSVNELPIYRVTYERPGAAKQTPTLAGLVSKKRAMFAYEHEVRVVLSRANKTESSILGHALPWDPEASVHSVRVHPEADGSFLDTVVTTVKDYAPALKDRVAWSDMNELPPF